jgi:hypothetical protein
LKPQGGSVDYQIHQTREQVADNHLQVHTGIGVAPHFIIDSEDKPEHENKGYHDIPIGIHVLPIKENGGRPVQEHPTGNDKAQDVDQNQQSGSGFCYKWLLSFVLTIHSQRAYFLYT